MGAHPATSSPTLPRQRALLTRRKLARALPGKQESQAKRPLPATAAKLGALPAEAPTGHPHTPPGWTPALLHVCVCVCACL